MSIRKTILALALAGAAVPAAFADGGYERPFKTTADASTKSRNDVQKEPEDFRRNPVGAGGSMLSDRDARFITPQHSYGFQNGSLVHTDKLPHDTPKPELSPLTDEQRSLYRGR